MKLNLLPKVLTRSKKRLGRGLGSGKGKTSARGQKGQKARGKVPASFSGGGLPLYLKIPFLRGLRNRSVSEKPVVLTLDKLSVYKANETVDLESLLKKGLIEGRQVLKRGVKILGEGELSVPLKINIAVSKSAAEKISKAGGEIV